MQLQKKSSIIVKSHSEFPSDACYYAATSTHSESPMPRSLPKIVLLSIIGCLAAPSAAFALKHTTGAEKVNLTQVRSEVEGCDLKGDVAAKPPFVLPNDWKVKLQNAAVEIGANVVLHNGPGIGSVKAQAYFCPPPEAAPNTPVPGCAKDTDCKGDRICEEGVCQSPSE